MAVAAEKYSASMDDELLDGARRSAEAEGLTLSGWLAEAAADRLRLRALAGVVAEWEAEHGTITADEIASLDVEIIQARRQAALRAGQAAAAS